MSAQLFDPDVAELDRHGGPDMHLQRQQTVLRRLRCLVVIESLESVIDATKHYLKRHKELLSIHYDRYILFLNYVTNLTKLDKKQKAELKILMKKLDENRTTIAREWLIEKIIEMK